MYENVQSLARRYQKPIAIVDTETTGFGNPSQTGIVEIAVLLIRPDGRISALNEMLNPGMPISPYSTRIHGITESMVKDRPGFDSVSEKLFAVYRKCVVSGFNLDYDTPLIKAKIKDCTGQVISDHDALDVRNIWRCVSKADKGTLTSVAAFYGVNVKRAHRAMDDVVTTTLILDEMLKRYGFSVVNESRKYNQEFDFARNPVEVSSERKGGQGGASRMR